MAEGSCSGNSEPPPWFGKALVQIDGLINEAFQRQLNLRLERHDLALGEVQDALGMVFERLGCVEHRFSMAPSPPPQGQAGAVSMETQMRASKLVTMEVPGERPCPPAIPLGAPTLCAPVSKQTASIQDRLSTGRYEAPVPGPTPGLSSERMRAASGDTQEQQGQRTSAVSSSVQPVRTSGNGPADVLYEPKPCWVIAAAHSAKSKLRPLQTGGLDLSVFNDEMIKKEKGRMRYFITDPESMRRFFWDVLGMVLICCDIVTIPLQFFDVDTPAPMVWFTCIFWTLDFAQAWFLGIYTEGRLEMRFRYIVRHYLQGWFLFDISLVSADWAMIGVAATSGGEDVESSKFGKIGKSLRVIRTMRSLRLLRLVKIKRALDRIKERITSDLTRTMFNIFGLMMLIVTINHIVACCWFGLSQYNHETGYRSWVGKHFHNRSLAGPDDYMRHQVTFSYKYVTSLHWSLTQFTPASMEITPRNTNERFFTVVLILFALVIFSSFVSSLTSAMTRYQNMRSERDRQFDLLRRFLRDKHVGHLVSMRVQRYIEHSIANSAKVVEDNQVLLLERLSLPLKMDLYNEIYGPTLCMHPFFQVYSGIDGGAMRKLCFESLKKIQLSFGDNLFDYGEPCTKMYFLLEGCLQYTPHDQPTSFPDSQREDVAEASAGVVALVPPETPTIRKVSFNLHPGAWCSEASLWTKFSHQGIMQSMGMSTVLTVDAEKFASVTSSHARIAPLAGCYGEAFVRQVNDCHRRGEHSDLEVFSCEDLVEEVCTTGTSYAEAASEVRRLSSAKPLNKKKSLIPALAHSLQNGRQSATITQAADNP